jgi:hypothetical protein
MFGWPALREAILSTLIELIHQRDVGPLDRVQLRVPGVGRIPGEFSEARLEIRSFKITTPAGEDFVAGDAQLFLRKPLQLVRRDGDRPVLQGVVAIWRQTKDRVVTFRIGDGPVHLFRINVPAKPVEIATMTPWSRTDLIEEGETTRKPNEGEAIEMRYRVY